MIQVAVAEGLIPFLDYTCNFSELCAQLLILSNFVHVWKVLFLARQDTVDDYTVTYLPCSHSKSKIGIIF